MRQEWRCRVCKVRSAVRFKKGAGVWEVVQRIADRHRRRSPACGGGRDDIRVMGELR